MAKKRRVSASAMVFSMLVAGTAQANLITNAGFETGDLAGWTFEAEDRDSVAFASPVAAHSGSYGARLGTLGPDLPSIRQTIETVPGATYNISFWLSNLRTGEVPDVLFEAVFDDAAFDFFPLGIIEAFGYTQFSFTQVATRTTADLVFVFRHDPSFFQLDDVSVESLTPLPVPEPGGLSILALGVGLVAVCTLRRRRLKTGAVS